MKRPEWRKCFPKLKYYIKDGYVEQLEEYCDDVECKLELAVCTNDILDREIDRLNAKLKIACDLLSDGYGYEYADDLVNSKGELTTNMEPEEWDELLERIVNCK